MSVTASTRGSRASASSFGSEREARWYGMPEALKASSSASPTALSRYRTAKSRKLISWARDGSFSRIDGKERRSADERFDGSANELPFSLGVWQPHEPHLGVRRNMGDEPSVPVVIAQGFLSRFQHFPLGTVVCLQPDRTRMGVVFGELREKPHIRAPKAVDGLVGISDEKEPLSAFRGQRANHLVLRPVHVLKFVYEEVPAEAPGKFAAVQRLILHKPERHDEQVVQIQSALPAQTILVRSIGRGHFILRVSGVRLHELLLEQTDPVQHRRGLSRSHLDPGLLYRVPEEAQSLFSFQYLFSGERSPALAIELENADSELMKRPHPAGRSTLRREEGSEPLLQFPCSFSGEGDDRDFLRLDGSALDQLDHAVAERPGLPGPGACLHEHRPVHYARCMLLLLVEAVV